ncbi:hypothetical protein O181_112091 [Austropuccinia psidii MF-1]|uniref:Uncharacterized protein n=1 Tax=Austropuccinia psidii MF-1 TaxID=1389203 RepID=A0A9Q3PT91_9BASI|nr:hypothetical protein [Austropuccinia psidii MF-1]
MAAAIPWVYHLSNLKQDSQKAIPLLQTAVDTLDLWPKSQLALQKFHMGPRHRDLLTIDGRIALLRLVTVVLNWTKSKAFKPT